MDEDSAQETGPSDFDMFTSQKYYITPIIAL